MRRNIQVESFVMVNVKQIAEMGAYVKLLEYDGFSGKSRREKLMIADNIDGMILLSELSRRRICGIQKLIRVGRNEVVVVLKTTNKQPWNDDSWLARPSSAARQQPTSRFNPSFSSAVPSPSALTCSSSSILCATAQRFPLSIPLTTFCDSRSLTKLRHSNGAMQLHRHWVVGLPEVHRLSLVGLAGPDEADHHL